MNAVDELVASLAVHDSNASRDVLTWWLAGLDAVEPRRRVRSALAEYPPTVDGSLLTDSVVVLAVGKAASAMAWGAGDALGDRISRGLVISDVQRSGPSWAATMVGDHPVPTARSATAAMAAIDLVDAVTSDQTLLALISGGVVHPSWRFPTSRSSSAMCRTSLISSSAAARPYRNHQRNPRPPFQSQGGTAGYAVQGNDCFLDSLRCLRIRPEQGRIRPDSCVT